MFKDLITRRGNISETDMENIVILRFGEKPSNESMKDVQIMRVFNQFVDECTSAWYYDISLPFVAPS